MIQEDKITPPVTKATPETPAKSQPERITDQLAPKPPKETGEQRPSESKEQPNKSSSPKPKGPQNGNKEGQRQGQKPQGQRPPHKHSHPPKQAESLPKPELPHGCVDYHAMTKEMMKAARFRRHQHTEANGPISTLRDIRKFHTVAIQGPSGSGQTNFVLQTFLKNYSETIVVVHEQKDLIAFQDQILEQMKQKKGKQPQFLQVYTVDAIITQLGRVGVPEVVKARQVVEITVDKDDENPAATIAGYMDEYVQKRDELRGAELRANHPLRRVKTIIVDDWKTCESSNLTFPRLVRFAQLCGQLPEFILVG
jgi:hypothetical protein